jgi:hypothetical protein
MYPNPQHWLDLYVLYCTLLVPYFYKKKRRCGRASEAQQNLLSAHTAESRTTRYSCPLPARIFGCSNLESSTIPTSNSAVNGRATVLENIVYLLLSSPLYFGRFIFRPFKSIFKLSKTEFLAFWHHRKSLNLKILSPPPPPPPRFFW